MKKIITYSFLLVSGATIFACDAALDQTTLAKKKSIKERMTGTCAWTPGNDVMSDGSGLEKARSATFDPIVGKTSMEAFGTMLKKLRNDTDTLIAEQQRFFQTAHSKEQEIDDYKRACQREIADLAAQSKQHNRKVTIFAATTTVLSAACFGFGAYCYVKKNR